jgi:hypothetical protein
MSSLSSRPARVLLALICLGATPSWPGVLADEISGGGSAHRLVVHDSAETLNDYCHRDAEGRLWLTLPGGSSFELITSIDDPSIVNQGDGAFHPFDAAEVQSALAAVRYPLETIRADVFLLPYPRRGGFPSAAGPALILLSPGVRPLSREQQHATLVHELGHVVQYQLMPDIDRSHWNAYRRLRGIQDASVYSDTGLHANRPHEIFAEDFRALFGDPLACYSGTIENSSLEPPSQVRGLDRFFLELIGAWPVASQLAVSPNPARGPLRFSRSGVEAAPLDVFDASGRRVATLDPIPVAGGVEWAWSGLDRSGRAVRNQVVFAKVRGESFGFARVAVLQ